MFRLFLLNSLGLGSNTPIQERNVNEDDLMIYTLKGSPRKFVRDYLQRQLGKGDVWVMDDNGSFAVIELTYSGYRITGTHDGRKFNSNKVEALIQGLNEYCSSAA
ncbi:MAG: hypothetical protein MI810_03030 [Flavobacteriales bacterium]|nr:hypothetical protein [Flavobacteriales bacterium]